MRPNKTTEAWRARIASKRPLTENRTTREHRERLDAKKRGLPPRESKPKDPYVPRGTPGTKDKRVKK